MWCYFLRMKICQNTSKSLSLQIMRLRDLKDMYCTHFKGNDQMLYHILMAE